MVRSFIFILLLFLLRPVTSYSQNWSSLGSGTNGQVLALCVYNNELIVGGSFTTAGGVNANYIAKWDGLSWSALGTGMNNPVYSLAVYNNELIAGGYFSTAGGNPAGCVAKWNGSTWTTLGTGMNSYVTALTSFNNVLFAGGAFTIAGGVNTVAIAKWNGSSWQGFTNSMNHIVHAFTVNRDTLFAGGQFSTPGNRVARLNGNTWESTAGVSPTVFALASYNNNIIYGGLFLGAGPNLVNCIVGWSGNSWILFNTGMNQYITSLTMYGSSLIAGGYFTTAGGVSANRIAKWGTGNWVPLGNGLNDAVFAMTVYHGELVAGGLFNYAGTGPANYIAKWNDNVGINSAGNEVPNSFKLHQNYPNPFNPSTTIKFDLPVKELVNIKIFDVMGREVITLHEGLLNAGSYETSWDASKVTSGTYFCRIAAGDFIETKIMMLIK
ncbi:MAG: T9SS type A sorting domain-containing protein [Ignavibacteria bacterium]|nr:T9SS type A sorting domain-containing protein [Ignavibacteria bacterium]